MLNNLAYFNYVKWLIDSPITIPPSDDILLFRSHKSNQVKFVNPYKFYAIKIIGVLRREK